MATPTLGNVPTTINDCETDNFTGADGTDADLVKEGTYSVAWIARGGSSDSCSFTVTNQDYSTDHLRVWINHAALPQLDTETNGGMEFYFTDGGNTGYWTLFGSDTYAGGWFNGVIYGGSSPDRNSGTAPAMTSVDVIGFYLNTTGLSSNKVNTWIDYVRYGDGYYATGGTSGDKITLATIASTDDTNGYGILLEADEVFFAYGELQIGNGATTTHFEMNGDVLVFVDAPVNTGLYKVIGDGAGCNVTITDSVLRGGGSTDSTRFVFDFDETNITGSNISITDNLITRASTSAFKSGSTVTGNTFNDCGQITHGGADMDNCTVKGYEGTAGTAALVYDVNADPDGEMDGMTFEKGTAATHAIEFGSNTPSSVTLRDQTYTSYNASNGQNDSTFYNNTGGALTINLQGATGNTSYRNGSGASTTVQATVTVKLTVNDEDGDPLQNARVRITANETVGTVTSGDLILTGLTDVNGEIETTSFNYESAFDPSGLDIAIKVRKATSSPYYKPFDGTGVILNTGFTGTVGMILDE